MYQLCLGCMNPIGTEKTCRYCGYVQGTPPKEAFHIPPGCLLGKYLIGRVLGSGGFGITYIAFDTQFKIRVAIKEYLPPELATRMPGDTQVTVYSGEKTVMFQAGKEKFLEEARRLANFTSETGIVKILDEFDSNGTSYIVMEYLDGETLRSRLEREKKMKPGEAISIIEPVLDALTVVHAKGIIHRDISPDNIFLTRDGKVKLLDFGAARYASANYSKSLSVILKPGYAPEEQYRSHGEQGPWSDVYACAATLYRMMTGTAPPDAMERCGEDTLKPLSKMGVHLDKNVETAIMNALNIYKDDRTQTAAAFRTELTGSEKIDRKKNTHKKHDWGKWKTWQKAAFVCMCVLTVGLIGVGAYGIAVGGTPFYVLNNTDSTMTKVPDVVMLNDSEAQSRITGAELVAKITNGDYSDVVEAGLIVNQGPEAGRTLPKGETVNMVMSMGPEKVMLEDVTGKKFDEAREILEKAGFVVEIQRENSNVEADYVIEQSYDPGMYKKGMTVTLMVSKGSRGVDFTQSVIIGSYVGSKYDKVREQLTENDIYVEKVTEYSSKPEGTILAQSIEPDTKVKKGTTITLTVSAGEQTVEMRNYTAWNYREAYTDLAAQGFTQIEMNYVQNTLYQKDLVCGQNIEAGTVVKPANTKIVLSVSNGGDSGAGTVQTVYVPPVTTTTAKVTTTAKKTTTATKTTALPDLSVTIASTTRAPSPKGVPAKYVIDNPDDYKKDSNNPMWTFPVSELMSDWQVICGVRYRIRLDETVTSDDYIIGGFCSESSIQSWSAIQYGFYRTENGDYNRFDGSDWNGTIKKIGDQVYELEYDYSLYAFSPEAEWGTISLQAWVGVPYSLESVTILTY